MAQFSSDQGKPPARFTPKSADVGSRAAERALKSHHGGGQGPGQGSPSKPRPGGSQPQLGHPRFDQGPGQAAGQAPDPSQDQSQDTRHLDLVGSWHNMKGLGRDIPWGVWAGLSGNYRQLAKDGQPPFDIFEDL